MGICIEITKLKTHDHKHMYEVSSNDFKNANCVISIDTLNNHILFYENTDQKHPVIKYDLDNKKLHIIKAGKISGKILPYVILQSTKAIKNKEFCQHIGYTA